MENSLSDFISKSSAREIEYGRWNVYPDGDENNGRIIVKGNNEFEAKEEAFFYLRELMSYIENSQS